MICYLTRRYISRNKSRVAALLSCSFTMFLEGGAVYPARGLAQPLAQGTLLSLTPGLEHERGSRFTLFFRLPLSLLKQLN